MQSSMPIDMTAPTEEFTAGVTEAAKQINEFKGPVAPAPLTGDITPGKWREHQRKLKAFRRALWKHRPGSGVLPMRSFTPPRNKPCPCLKHGKKYKDCCISLAVMPYLAVKKPGTPTPVKSASK